MGILYDIKKLLGLFEDDQCYDLDIKILINSAFSTLYQLGVGPKNPFKIEGSEEGWEDFIGDATDIESVKEYIFLKTKIIFDPPQSSFVLEAMQKKIEELEWRLNVECEEVTDDG